MGATVRFVLNGQQHVASDLDPNLTLLSYLREQGLTGAKESCAEGECGACAVLCVAPRGTAAKECEPQVINACLQLAVAAEGTELWTVEGIADREASGAERLHPVQAAMVRTGGSQCGYCTPGFVMSLVAYYYSEPRKDPVGALSGNLCRCTGYRPILEAARGLPSPDGSDSLARRFARAAPEPKAFHYESAGVRFDRPTDLETALRLRSEYPQAKCLAGGTDLIVGLNQDFARQSHWLALGEVEELRRVEWDEDWIRIGPAVTWRTLEECVAPELPVIGELTRLFASPLIRSRGTLGGNLMTASPVGDGAPVFLALDASVSLRNRAGERTLPLAGFFLAYRETAIAADELLTEIRVPRRAPSFLRFYKVTKRELDDISSVSAGLAVDLDGDRVTRARFAFGGVAATPLRARLAEEALVGNALDPDSLARVQDAAVAAFAPIDDVRASAAYRSAMIRNLLAKFWDEFAAQAGRAAGGEE